MDEHPKDHGDGVQAVPGGRGAGRRGLHLENDGRWEEIQRAAAVVDTMPRVQEGAG